MLHIYQANSDLFREKIPLEIMIADLPKSLQQRAFRYRFAQDTYNFAVGRKMIEQGLQALGIDEVWEKITYQKNGKPIHPDAFFNISHSGNRVVGAFSKSGAVGIDVEVLKPIELKDFDSFFFQKEWTNIYGSKNPLHRFYWYWTRKESIIKALSVTLDYLHQIELDAAQDFFLVDGKKWFLQDLDFGEDVFGAICSEEEIDDIKYPTFSFDFS